MWIRLSLSRRFFSVSHRPLSHGPSLSPAREKIPLSQIHLGFEKYQPPPKKGGDDDVFWPAVLLSGIALSCTVVLGLAGDKEIAVKRELEEERKKRAEQQI